MSSIKRYSPLIGKVRTREAPSPTGYPHVGTAFQALFNWIYARRYQGHFILRIEDTDQKRYVPGSEEVIFQALKWLALSPDESSEVGGPYGPYRQSERLAIYQQYAQQLINQGQAYYCFCSSERLAKMREEQQAKKIPPKYDRLCRQLSQEEVKNRLAAGEKAVIRMKIPDNQTIIVHDLLRGEVKFDANTIDDQIILKSDGYPTYHLAVVVDDHLMKITHMKRGEEWLSSAPKHILLYQYFGWQPPLMIHTPVLRNPDRSKLSKRKGNTSLWWYREAGFLKDALLNFLALLVWKPPNQREIFSLQDMIDNFEWKQLNVTGPIFDLTKLQWLNGVYLRKLDDQKLLIEIKAWAEWVLKNGQDKKIIDSAEKIIIWLKQDQSLFKHAIKLAQERLKTLAEIAEAIAFYYQDQLIYDRQDLLQKQSADLIKKMLLEVTKRLQKTTDLNQENWDQTIRSCADEFQVKPKVLFMSMRSAITAQEFTPPLFDVMEVLGWQKSFQRMEAAVKFLT